MGTIEDVNAAFDAAEAQIGETEGVEDSAGALIDFFRTENDAQEAELQRLRDQVAQGSAATTEQLDAVIQRAQAFSARLDQSEGRLAAKVATNP